MISWPGLADARAGSAAVPVQAVLASVPSDAENTALVPPAVVTLIGPNTASFFRSSLMIARPLLTSGAALEETLVSGNATLPKV